MAETQAADGYEWAWCVECSREVALDADGNHAAAGSGLICLGEPVPYLQHRTDTGRILLVSDEGEILAVHTPEGPWRPRSRDDAEWCVEQLVDARAGLAAVEVRRKAYVESLARQAKTHERRENFFLRLLEEWTRGELDGTKHRHLDVDGARLQLRRTPGRTEVMEAHAIAHLGESHPAVKVLRSVLVSRLTAEAQRELEGLGLLVHHEGEDRFAADTR